MLQKIVCVGGHVGGGRDDLVAEDPSCLIVPAPMPAEHRAVEAMRTQAAVPLGTRLRIALLSSGLETMLSYLLGAISSGLNAEVVGVVADRDCSSYRHAVRNGIPAHIIRRNDRHDVEAFSERVFSLVGDMKTDVVVSEFLPRLRIPQAFRRRVVGVHPSLLPSFGGKGYFGIHILRATLERGVKVTGCTVFFLDDGLDTGPIVSQRAVDVLRDDTVSTLGARLSDLSLVALVDVLRAIVSGDVVLGTDS